MGPPEVKTCDFMTRCGNWGRQKSTSALARFAGTCRNLPPNLVTKQTFNKDKKCHPRCLRHERQTDPDVSFGWFERNGFTALMPKPTCRAWIRIPLPKSFLATGSSTLCFRGMVVKRTVGAHEPIGMAATRETAQFRSNPLPSKGSWASGLSRCRGQEWGDKSSRRGAGLEGDGWGDAYKATRPRVKQTWMSLLSTYHNPSLHGENTLSHVGPAKLYATSHNASDK